MRIAVLTNYRRAIAGAEVYLEIVLSKLAVGNEFVLICDQDGPTERQPLTLPKGSQVWLSDRRQVRDTVRDLRSWQPDVVYCHGTGNPELEAGTLTVAPAVLMAHTYYGTCISGTKTRQSPICSPCHRTFGPACLVHYFPRRCGGRNPITMARLYRLQRRRLRILHDYQSVMTLSEHMRQEFVAHGLQMDRVVKLPPLGFEDAPPPSPRTTLPIVDETRRLLFLGRFEKLKGGDLLIQAMPAIASALGRVHLTLAGDGPEAMRWKALAQKAEFADRRVTIEFVGWVGEQEKHDLLAKADALVVPSVWPEPYGLVGLEAARHSVPAVAFDVGGIREWLHDGVTGCIAPSIPQPARGLTDAIVRCLADRANARRLGNGARELAVNSCRSEHVNVVRQVLERAASTGTP